MVFRTGRDAAPLGARTRAMFETEPLPAGKATPSRQPERASAIRDDVGGDVPAFDFHPALDELPEENVLTIDVNGKPAALLLCSANALRELAVGWAFAQGFFDETAGIRHISEARDLVSLMVDDGACGGRRWAALVASGFDGSVLRSPRDLSQILKHVEEVGPSAAGWTISRGTFLGVVGRIFERFGAERGLGGYHHAGAGDGAGVCIVARDVSRHNAVDKVVGWSLLHRVERSSLVLCLSGRVTVDIAFKAWRAGFPMVAASGLPTVDAVDVAEATGVTIVGHALDDRRTVFSHGWRLVQDEEV